MQQIIFMRILNLPHVLRFVNVSLLSSGYMGTYCEVDIDDCESNPCVNDGICRDMVNGFTCTCQPGKIIE